MADYRQNVLDPDDIVHVVYELEAYGFGLAFDAHGRFKVALTPQEVEATRGTQRIIDPRNTDTFSEAWQDRALQSFNRYFGRCFRHGSPVTDSHRSFGPHLDEILGGRVEGRALDLGAGAQQYLKGIDGPVVACDIAPPVGSRGAKGRFVLASGSRLPFRSSSFDLILCLFVLEHVAAPGELIGEISRLLATGGRAVVAVPSERPGALLAAKVLRRRLPLSLHHVRSFGLISHQFVASSRKLHQSLEGEGCQTRTMAIDPPIPGFLGEGLRKWLSSLYPFSHCGNQTVFIAEKP